MRLDGMVKRTALLVICGLSTGLLAEEDPTDMLADMSIQELMNDRVTLASRSGQRLADTPAAVHILTQKDIRRSGATSIPELLRLVPGLQVARIDANKWAISSRGFNERFANKLLVLIDGRSVYQPSFSGVYWEEQDVILEDVERIEVIRGPGATLWGANAVNGIINVVTKEAAATQGGLISSVVGIEDRAIVSLRYGGDMGPDRHYRTYAKYTNRESTTDTTGRDAGDGWSTMRAGGRLDWDKDESTSVRVEGELLLGNLTNQLQLPILEAPFFQRQKDDIDVVAGHLQGRWTRTTTDLGTWTSQVFYSYHDRQEFIAQNTQTLDFDLQHDWRRGIHHLVWGGGYRASRDQIGTSLALSVAERSRIVDRLSFFAQDDVALVPERFHFIIGSKIEHDEFTGTEVQPNARLRWTPSSSQTYWGAVSRAVRTPSRGEIDIRGILPNSSIQQALLPEGVTAGFASFTGNSQMQAENLVAYEVGGRFSVGDGLLIDLTAFVNSYDDLRSLALRSAFVDSSGATSILFLPIVFQNDVEGTTKGFEAVVDAQVLDAVGIQAHYSYLDIDLKDPSGKAFGVDLDAGSSPHHQFLLKAAFDPTSKFSLDVTVRYVDDLSAFSVQDYTEADVRAAYRLTQDLEVELLGRNLLNSRHEEFFAPSLFMVPAEVERDFHTGLRWRF